MDKRFRTSDPPDLGQVSEDAMMTSTEAGGDEAWKQAFLPFSPFYEVRKAENVS